MKRPSRPSVARAEAPFPPAPACAPLAPPPPPKSSTFQKNTSSANVSSYYLIPNRNITFLHFRTANDRFSFYSKRKRLGPFRKALQAREQPRLLRRFLEDDRAQSWGAGVSFDV